MTEEQFDQLVDLIGTVVSYGGAAREHPADRPRQDSLARRYEEALAFHRMLMVDEVETYWHHPESGSVFEVAAGEPRPTDVLVHEIDRATFLRLRDHYSFDHDSLA